MQDNSFESKWRTIRFEGDRNRDNTRESVLYIEPGEIPRTQRQLSLYNYYLYFRTVLLAHGAKDVLETGCGRGTLALYFAAYDKMRVSLLDSSKDAIEIARLEYGKRNIEAVFHVGDSLVTKFPAESYDAVVTWGLAEHFEPAQVPAFFAEQLRLLRPGGVLISGNIPKKPSIQMLNVWMRGIKKLFGRYQGSPSADYFRNSLKPRDYIEAARSAGFSDITTINVAPFPLFTPISMANDRRITGFYRAILRVRGVFQTYPFKTNYFASQAHILVGYKRAR